MIPTKFDPKFINQVFFPNEVEIDRLDLINYGQCCDWSFLCWLAWRSQVRLWSCCCHAFIQANGRFYDSEALTGVAKWQELRTCRELNCSESVLFVAVQDYMEDWAPGEIHWKQLAKRFREKVLR